MSTPQATVEEALKVLDADHIDLVLTDLRLGGEDGMALIEMVLQRPRPPVCMLMTAYGSIATAVEALKRGAYDFVTKPVNIDELGLKDRARHQGAPDRARKSFSSGNRSTNVSVWKTSSANPARCMKSSIRFARSPPVAPQFS